MKITKLSETPIGKNPHNVDARMMYNTENAMVVVITLQPGEALKLHKTPVDVFFYVLEGEGVIEIGDERETAYKDDLIDSPSNIPHRWINESGSIFRVLVGKVPGPTAETKIL